MIRKIQRVIFALAFSVLVIAPVRARAEVVPLLDGLGDLHYPITTRSARAQRFFDQGLRFVYAFNHAEAIRAFRETARLDTQCAMAHWGQALALGPNINAPMNRKSELKACESITKALALKKYATRKESDLIDALARRYSKDEKSDRVKLDRMYANAMRVLTKRYPSDLEIATLFAESLMDLRPWNFWTKEGHPQPETIEIVSTLESVMKRNPNHPGAIHYYIHAVEASKSPERAVAGADRLGRLMPGAGHLVHMPAHIYIHVGRFVDAVEVNLRAIAADEGYIAQCKAQGAYPLAYYPHNMHFLFWAAAMEGRGELAISAAKRLATKVLKDELPDPSACACCPKLLVSSPYGDKSDLKDISALLYGAHQNFLVAHLFALAQFGKWDDVFQEPKPEGNRPFSVGVWHFVRGMAFRGQGKLEEAMSELDLLRQIAEDRSLRTLDVGGNMGASVLDIAREVLAGEIDAKQGDLETALTHLDRAVRLEDALNYIEPPSWYFPVRQTLGAVLIEAGRPLEAEVVYRADLAKHPENGWSLLGLKKSLEAQGKTDDAREVEKRLRKAWARADVSPESSRF